MSARTVTARGGAIAEVLRSAFDEIAELEKSSPADVDSIVSMTVAHLRSWRPEAVGPMGALTTPGATIREHDHGAASVVTRTPREANALRLLAEQRRAMTERRSSAIGSMLDLALAGLDVPIEKLDEVAAIEARLEQLADLQDAIGMRQCWVFDPADVDDGQCDQ